MGKEDISVPSDFPLHNIKKIEQTESKIHVNQLLSRGWVLLAVGIEGDTQMGQDIIFTLGHTDPSADASFKENARDYPIE